jgi:stage III sporulation protein AB
MLKYLGVAMIIAAGGVLGFLKSRVYSNYAGLLQGLALAAEVLETEVRFKQSPLERAFAETGRAANHPEVAGLFLTAAAYAEAHHRSLPQEAWAAGVASLKKCIPQGEPLAAYLLDFGQALGRTDLQAQQALFALLRRQLEQGLSRAAAKEEKEGRLWQYLGVAGAVILVILLI